MSAISSRGISAKLDEIWNARRPPGSTFSADPDAYPSGSPLEPMNTASTLAESTRVVPSLTNSPVTSTPSRLDLRTLVFATVGVRWAVVTNGREWALYDSHAQAALSGKRMFELNLLDWESDGEYQTVFDRLWLVSKEAFQTGGGPATWAAAQQLHHELQTALADPASPEIKAIRGALLKRGVTATTEGIASWLEGRINQSTTLGTSVNTATATATPPTSQPAVIPPKPPIAVPATPTPGTGYWIVPAGRKKGVSAEQHLQWWLTKGFWGFWENTPARKLVKAGDWVAFYASGTKSIMAYARVTDDPSQLVHPDEWPEPTPPTQTTYKLPLVDVVWMEPPMKLDLTLRQALDAYSAKNPAVKWEWLVWTTRRVTAADFGRLTRQTP